MCAAEKGNLKIMKVLFKYGANPNIQNTEGHTALMIASHQGDSQVVELLLKKNADPNIQNNNGLTALMYASYQGHLQVVELLLKENADPNIPNNKGITAFICASYQGHLQIVELLLIKGSILNIRYNNRHTALEIAGQKNHLNVVELLFRKGPLTKVMEQPHALLQEWLDLLVEWEKFAIYLPGITYDMISKIDKDKHNVSNKKIELHSKWLSVWPTASWNDVIIALEKAEEYTLAEGIKQKLHQCSLDYTTNAQSTQPVSGSCTSKITLHEEHDTLFSHIAIMQELQATVRYLSMIATSGINQLSNLFGNVQTKSRPPEVPEERRPKIHELSEWLRVLVEWKIFGLHLPKITDDIIQKIDRDSKNTDDKKRDLYSKWLSVCPTASWSDIIIALEKAKEYTLAEDIKVKINYGVTAPKPKHV